MYDKCSDCEYKDVENLRLENQELKKQLEDYKKWYQYELEENYKLSQLWCDSKAKTIELEIQQKEFIEWLEDKIKQKQKNLKDSSFAMAVVYTKAQIFTLQNALNEYKEIIGVKE